MVKRPILIVDNPIDVPVPIFGAVAIFVLYNMSRVYAGSKMFPSVSSDAITQMIVAIAGMGGLFLAVLFLRTFRGQHSALLGSTFGKDNDYQVWNIIGAVFTYFGIEVIGMILQGKMFQVTAIDVYAFYLSGAIAEELLYRGALVTTVQALLGRVFKPKNEQAALPMNIICILLSGSIFAAVHVPYYGKPALMVMTFLGGCGQALWYIRSKSLFVVIIPHAIINWLASTSWLQSLTPSTASAGGLPDLCQCIQATMDVPGWVPQILCLCGIAMGIYVCWRFSRSAQTRLKRAICLAGATCLLCLFIYVTVTWNLLSSPYPNSWSFGGGFR